VDLPSYPWNRDRVFWQESAAVAAYRNRKTPRLDLLGVLDENSTLSEPSWNNYLRISEQPWIEHHKFQGTNIYPMAGMIVMAIEGLRQILNPAEVKGYQFRDVTVHQALVVPSDQSVQTKLDIRPWRHGSRARTVFWRDFTVSSRSQDGAWTTNATGLVCVEMKTSKSDSSIFVDEEKEAAKELKAQLSRVEAIPLETQDPDEFYSDVSVEYFTRNADN
jgi:acyl transferase domain-containing protein